MKRLLSEATASAHRFLLIRTLSGHNISVIVKGDTSKHVNIRRCDSRSITGRYHDGALRECPNLSTTKMASVNVYYIHSSSLVDVRA